MVPTHLRSLQALELAIRTGSLKTASERLAITPAAVGQRIKALEDYLGFDLLMRGRSGIRPTPELAKALAHINAAFGELDTAADILDFQRVQEIHVVANTDWAELWLKPRLGTYRKANPTILFCVNGVGDVPLRLGQADCEIWFGDRRGQTGESMLFRDYLAPVSSPENRKRLRALPDTECLEGFPLLHLSCYASDKRAVGWPEWSKAFGYRRTGSERGIRYSHVVQALEAVYSGAGLAICGLSLIQEQLESGKLCLPFDIAQGAWTEHGYYVAFRENALRRAQIQHFHSWMLQEAKLTAEYLAKSLRK